MRNKGSALVITLITIRFQRMSAAGSAVLKRAFLAEPFAGFADAAAQRKKGPFIFEFQTNGLCEVPQINQYEKIFLRTQCPHRSR